MLKFEPLVLRGNIISFIALATVSETRGQGGMLFRIPNLNCKGLLTHRRNDALSEDIDQIIFQILEMQLC